MEVARAAHAIGRSVDDLLLVMDVDRLDLHTSLGDIVAYTRFTHFSPVDQPPAQV